MDITDQQLRDMIDRLERMHGPDEKGCYLGNGVTPGVPLRSQELAVYLRELLEKRQ